MEQITLKELAAYLPYGLNAQWNDTRNPHFKPIDGRIVEVRMRNAVHFVSIENDKEINDCAIFECKPYLRPLSQLTEEIEIEGEKFVPIVELAKISLKELNLNFNNITYDNWANSKGIYFDQTEEEKWYFGLNHRDFSWQTVQNMWNEMDGRLEFSTSKQMELFQKLHEWHFDLYNLIPRGLAIQLPS